MQRPTLTILTPLATYNAIILSASQTPRVRAYIFAAQLEFLRHLHQYAHAASEFRIIANQRNTPKSVEALLKIFPAHTRWWPPNRTMHRKLWIFEDDGKAIITTTNATTGSHHLALNEGYLCTDPVVVAAMAAEHQRYWQNCAREPQPQKPTLTKAPKPPPE